MKNIVLIGMSAVGKSKSAEHLSKILNKELFDEDNEFEASSGLKYKLMHTYQEGVLEFEREKHLIKMYSLGNKIISAGGGTGMIKNLKKKFKEPTIIILLKPSLKYILEKYEEKKYDTSEENLRRKLVFDTPENIEKEYYRRYALMEKNADIILDTSYMKKREIASLIVTKVKK